MCCTSDHMPPNCVMDELINANFAVRGTDEVEKVTCECCGMSEDCTRRYVERIKDEFCAQWVCGLCSEAINERLRRSRAATTTEEAIRMHASLCNKFNSTTRLNPKLSFASSMRDIARKSSQRRVTAVTLDACSTPRIGRSASCLPKLGVGRIHQLDDN